MKVLTGKQIAERFLNLAPAEWSQAMNYKWAPKMNSGSYQEAVGFLEGRAQRCVMLAAYMETRSGGDGCGLKDHAEGVKAANKALTKIRKAQGFSYPHSGGFSF
jgi:hypothetical protein